VANDVQLEAIGALIKAKLGTSACQIVYPWQLVGPPPRPAAPFLEIYRQGGTFSQAGNRGQRKNLVKVAINLYHGPKPHGAFGPSFKELAESAEKIDEVVSEGKDAAWTASVGSPPTVTPLQLWDETDTTFVRSFGIESLVVGDYDFAYAYPGEGKREIYPCVQMQALMLGRTRNYVSGTELLTRIDGNLTEGDDTAQVDWAETFGTGGPVGTWVPKIGGVSVVRTVGAGPVVAHAVDRTVTVSGIVAGTTTLTQIAAALAADDDCDELLGITGTGTVHATYAGGASHNLWTYGWHIVKFRAVTT
jgi:hypothetical protein